MRRFYETLSTAFIIFSFSGRLPSAKVNVPASGHAGFPGGSSMLFRMFKENFQQRSAGSASKFFIGRL